MPLGNPEITYNVVDNNPTTIRLTGNANTLIKHYSNAAVEMAVRSTSGGAINTDTMIIRNGDRTIYGYIWEFNNVYDNSFTFSAEDEYGNVGRASYTAQMIEYEKVTCQISNNKPDGGGNMTVACSGTWYNGIFGVYGNVLSAYYRYVEAGQDIESAPWNAMVVSTSGNAYSASAYLSGLDYQKSYVFEVRASDLLSVGEDNSFGVKGAPVFHWGKNDVTFEVPVYFNNGATGIDLPEIPDLQYGEWYPVLVDANIYSNTAMNGWYLKVGNVVTIGFYIKAGVQLSDASQVRIAGNPFSPMYRASGGGICSGVKISAGLNFQCFVAEEGGVITTRAQDCEPKTDQHLYTSASGCYYPINFGEITLSGTITYLTY